MRTITAMFETKQAADTAVTKLRTLGIAEKDVWRHGGEQPAMVEDSEGGLWGTLKDLFLPDEDRSAYAEGLERGQCLVSARVDDSFHQRAMDILEEAGAVDLDKQEAAWRKEGWTGTYGDRAAVGTETRSEMVEDVAAEGRTRRGRGSVPSMSGTDDDDVIPVVEEQLRVGKRETGHGRVRVRSYVTEQPFEEDVTLRDERVSVERRPVDRAAMVNEDFKDRSIEMDESREEAVVDKTARVVEEVSLRKEGSSRTETVRDTVRKTEVEVENDREPELTRGRR